MTVLSGSGLSLTQAARIAIEFHGVRTSGVSVNDSVTALLNAKSKESARYQKDLRLKLEKFSRAFPNRKLAENPAKEIRNWLSERGAAVTQKNNYRRVLSVLFAHAKTEECLTRKEMGHYGRPSVAFRR